MKRIRELELHLVRVETVLIVVLVLVMLGLAGYNVFYRNVLVPLQKHYAHSGPVVETLVAETPPDGAPDATVTTPEVAHDSDADEVEGFRGGFGQASASADDDADSDDPFADVDELPSADDDGDDDAGGFGGAFGRADEDEDEDVSDEDEAEDDDAGGFGGAFGKTREADPDEDEGDDGFGGAFGKASKTDDSDEDEEEDEDPFASLPEIDQAGAIDPIDSEPKGGPPPAGSFAAWAVDVVDALKLDWIDIFLRQLVIIVAFLGAMLATRRRKHINIDALSRLLPASAVRSVSMATNLLAIVVCLVLASAGLELVKISREHPKDLMPWADEWMFQLMFPIGFSLLALHFVVRLLEVATGQVPDLPPPVSAVQAPDAAEAVSEDEDGDEASIAESNEGEEEVRS